jgi:hypothetical protein
LNFNEEDHLFNASQVWSLLQRGSDAWILIRLMLRLVPALGLLTPLALPSHDRNLFSRPVSSRPLS